MADAALTENLVATRADTVRRFGRRDAGFRGLTGLAALLVVAVFAGVIFSLLIGAMPAIQKFGFSFITSDAWDPVAENYGARASIYGTLVTSIIAMLIAVPVGIGIAIFLTEICPRPLRRPIGIAIELLAGIPSIIYGIWGLLVFAPWFGTHVQKPVIDATAGVPVLQDILGGAPFGIGVMTAALILSIMVLPFISAVTRD